jgi:hypothetical protein
MREVAALTILTPARALHIPLAHSSPPMKYAIELNKGNHAHEAWLGERPALGAVVLDVRLEWGGGLSPFWCYEVLIYDAEGVWLCLCRFSGLEGVCQRHHVDGCPPRVPFSSWSPSVGAERGKAFARIFDAHPELLPYTTKCS